MIQEQSKATKQKLELHTQSMMNETLKFNYEELLEGMKAMNKTNEALRDKVKMLKRELKDRREE